MYAYKHTQEYLQEQTCTHTNKYLFAVEKFHRWMRCLWFVGKLLWFTDVSQMLDEVVGHVPKHISAVCSLLDYQVPLNCLLYEWKMFSGRFSSCWLNCENNKSFPSYNILYILPAPNWQIYYLSLHIWTMNNNELDFVGQNLFY